ncbi:MAG: hypothetical protein R2856_23300 [Caldilineaceae bacterium]|nr:hypothetical protein [Caldilineaceae bacterium]
MSNPANRPLRPHVLELALQYEESTLFHQTRAEMQSLLGAAKNTLPSSSQIRGLANAISPQGAGDSAHCQLLRLHSLVTRQLIRQQNTDDITVPEPIQELQPGSTPNFWTYVAGRLRALRGDDSAPGKSEQIWADVQKRYNLAAADGEPTPAQLDLIHLRLVQAFVYAVSETWEHPHAFTQEETA